ncbi:hypothetical protein MATL_G00238900 [Megalops atlanticus]|uniref:Uncharacterized protein n=1 Tax=Megalops atlanticus TaxID=7932 RepID=A0A9D3PBU1_MEGAT|nr:hypothetical protein MATL_G00238900 [Megalops atlanticus]
MGCDGLQDISPNVQKSCGTECIRSSYDAVHRQGCGKWPNGQSRLDPARPCPSKSDVTEKTLSLQNHSEDQRF